MTVDFQSTRDNPSPYRRGLFSVELTVLLDDARAQLEGQSWGIAEIAARFHHRLVYLHPFPNGNGRFARTMTRYIAALQAADRRNYRALFDLLGVQKPEEGSTVKGTR